MGGRLAEVERVRGEYRLRPQPQTAGNHTAFGRSESLFLGPLNMEEFHSKSTQLGRRQEQMCLVCEKFHISAMDSVTMPQEDGCERILTLCSHSVFSGAGSSLR